MDGTFHEHCKFFQRRLSDKLGSRNLLKLILDVNLMENKYNPGVDIFFSIETITFVFNKHLVNGVLQVDIIRLYQMEANIVLGIKVTGSDLPHHEARSRCVAEDDVRLLQSLPHNVSLDYSGMSKSLVGYFEASIPLHSANSISSHFTQSPRVLLAEDNDVNALVFCSFLESWSIEVIRVTNGKDALEHLGSGGFDLLLLDLHMPVMGGLEVLSQMRILGHRTPVIVLTASTIDSEISESLSRGASSFLLKPVSGEQLRSAVKRHINWK